MSDLADRYLHLANRLEVIYVVDGFRAQLITDREDVTHEGGGETVVDAISNLKEVEE